METTFVILAHETLARYIQHEEKAVPIQRIQDGEIIESDGQFIPIDVAMATFDVRLDRVDIIWSVRAIRDSQWTDISAADRDEFLELFRNLTTHPMKNDDGAYRFVGAGV